MNLSNPRDALQILSQVGADFKGTRQDHLNIQQAEQTLRVFIEQHDPLEPSGDAPSTPANENQEKKDNLKNVDSPSNTTDTPEENKVLSKKKK